MFGKGRKTRAILLSAGTFAELPATIASGAHALIGDDLACKHVSAGQGGELLALLDIGRGAVYTETRTIKSRGSPGRRLGRRKCSRSPLLGRREVRDLGRVAGVAGLLPAVPLASTLAASLWKGG